MRKAAIEKLLMSLFSFDELMRFLRFGPQGEEILASLPMVKASFVDVASQAVEILNRRGLIDERFFMQLKVERPNRITDIEQVEHTWSLSLTPDLAETVVAKQSDITGALNDDRECSNTAKKVTTHARSPQQRVRTGIFISYSHKDGRWLERLQTYLKPLEREALLNRWDDTKIKPGQQWKDEIAAALQSAKIAVLLVSANFLASDFIAKSELPSLLTAAESDGLTVPPVIVGPCRFDRTEALGKFQAVNSPSKALNEMGKAEQDRVFLKLVERIEELLITAPS